MGKFWHHWEIRKRWFWRGVSRRAEIEQGKGNYWKVCDQASGEMWHLSEKVDLQHQALKEDTAIKQKQVHHCTLLCLQGWTVFVFRDGMGSRRWHLYSHWLELAKVKWLQKSRIGCCQIRTWLFDSRNVVSSFSRLHVQRSKTGKHPHLLKRLCQTDWFRVGEVVSWKLTSSDLSGHNHLLCSRDGDEERIR